MSDTLNVENRDQTGSLRMRRMRAAGKIPAVLYGHGQDNVNLSIDSRDVQRMIRDSAHIVTLAGAVSESALVKEVQWDSFGSEVMHIDLARIDASESVEVSLSVELRGVAPGTRAGGIVRHQVHEAQIRCPANQLPDHIEVNINQLELEGSITAADLDIPDVAELLLDPATIIVSCDVPKTVAEPDADEEGATAAEPEVIGRKEEDSEGGDE